MTVIIPHFNNLNGLERMLASTVSMGLDVIVVDDKSTETVKKGLKGLVPHYSHVQLLHNRSPQKGAGVARNIGLSACHTKWVLFADADDWFLEEAGQVLSDKLREKSTVDVMYFSPMSSFDDGLNVGKQSQRHKPYEKLVRKYLVDGNEAIRYQYPVPWSKVFNLHFLKKNNIQFDSGVASNDVMFSLKAGFFAKEIIAYADNIYMVTEGSSSLTKQKSKKITRSRFLVTMRYNRFLKKRCNVKGYQCSLKTALRLYSSDVKVVSKLFLLKRFIRSRWRIL